jgi:hypothetical protein
MALATYICDIKVCASAYIARKLSSNIALAQGKMTNMAPTAVYDRNSIQCYDPNALSYMLTAATCIQMPLDISAQ